MRMKRIIVPTDFSENADAALQYAIAIAKKEKAKIILVHACNIPLSIQGNSSYLFEKKLTALEEDAIMKLKISCFEISKLKVNCEYLIKLGAPVDIILKTVRKIKPDLV